MKPGNDLDVAGLCLSAGCVSQCASPGALTDSSGSASSELRLGALSSSIRVEHREWNFGAADEPYPCWICEEPSAGHPYACPAPSGTESLRARGLQRSHSRSQRPSSLATAIPCPGKGASCSRDRSRG